MFATGLSADENIRVSTRRQRILLRHRTLAGTRARGCSRTHYLEWT